MSAPPSPWLTAAEAAIYAKRGRKFIQREIRAGRLRAAIVGGRREALTRTEWVDEWVMNHEKPMPFPVRARVG